MNFGDDASCLCRYLNILFLPTIRFESRLSLVPASSRSELNGIAKCPEVLAFFSQRLLLAISYRSFMGSIEGSLRQFLLLIAEEESRMLPGERLNWFFGSASARLLAALLLLFSKSLSLPGLFELAWKAECAWKLMPSFSLCRESLFRLLLLLSPAVKACSTFFEEAELLFGLLNWLSDSSVRSLSKEALASLMNFSWIFLSTSCLRSSRVLTWRLGTTLMIFSISSTKELKLTTVTSLLIQLVLRSCRASTILWNFLSSPSLLYSMSSTRLPFSKKPLTQFFFSEFLRMPWPSKTLFLNSPTQMFPFLNIFSPIPFSCVFMQQPRSTSRSSNSSSLRCVSGLYPPCDPRQMKLKPSPLMKPFFSNPTTMRLPCFCVSIRGILEKSYLITRECVVPIRKSVSPRSNTRLNTLKSFYYDLSTMLPRLNSAQMMDFVMQLSRTAFPSSSPSALQLRKTRKPSVRQAHSLNLFLLQMAERSPKVSKKMLWPWSWSLQQEVMAERPESCRRMPLPSFLNDLIPPMYIAFLQWQQQSEEFCCPACPPPEIFDFEGLRLFSRAFFIGDFFIIILYRFISFIARQTAGRKVWEGQQQRA